MATVETPAFAPILPGGVSNRSWSLDRPPVTPSSPRNRQHEAMLDKRADPHIEIEKARAEKVEAKLVKWLVGTGLVIIGTIVAPISRLPT